MGYGSSGGRPIERASKISHAEVINNPRVADFLSRCVLPSAADKNVVATTVQGLQSSVDTSDIKVVIAIDGGYTVAPVREEYPYATVAFFTFGPLMFELSALRALDSQRFIAPEDMARLKNLERYTLVLPVRGIRSKSGRNLVDTIRHAIYEFFANTGSDGDPLMDTLRWFLFRKWNRDPKEESTQTIEWCPNPRCAQQAITFRYDDGDKIECPSCGQTIYLTDVFRLHERVEEEQGAGAILAYVMTLLEQIVLVHLIRTVLGIRESLLRDILFIKDGPLAFFGLVAPLYKPMRELLAYLLQSTEKCAAPQLRLVGLEKSGAFVEHAAGIQEHMSPGSFLICTNEYIYRHIVPGDPLTSLYGSNTYYGQKVMFRASSGAMYVATLPTREYSAAPKAEDIPYLHEILNVVSELRCSMYDNALVPIALVNKLVSLSDYPSQRILATFAKKSIGS